MAKALVSHILFDEDSVRTVDSERTLVAVMDRVVLRIRQCTPIFRHVEVDGISGDFTFFRGQLCSCLDTVNFSEIFTKGGSGT